MHPIGATIVNCEIYAKVNADVYVARISREAHRMIIKAKVTKAQQRKILLDHCITIRLGSPQ